MKEKLLLSLKIAINAVLNENETEILMIQEAKEHSRGLWFLPAGKGKEGELITETCIRETIEEGGVLTQPIYLLKIAEFIRRITIEEGEMRDVDIFRYTFVSKVLDGNVKKHETKDSIQAKWIPLEEVKNLPLRSLEVLDVIELYKKKKLENTLTKVEEILELV
jgi:ADP-ribose pyrophosphatase YjhB (NUDIX family)